MSRCDTCELPINNRSFKYCVKYSKHCVHRAPVRDTLIGQDLPMPIFNRIELVQIVIALTLCIKEMNVMQALPYRKMLIRIGEYLKKTR